MGQAVTARGAVAEKTLVKLFDGTEPSVSLLTTLVSNGHMIAGSVDGVASSPDVSATTGSNTLLALTASVAKSFFAYAIATVWPLAGTNAFVLDSGYNCGAAPTINTLTADVMKLTGGCYGGKQYYLVYPSGDAEICHQDCVPQCTTGTKCGPNTFSAPPGLSTLDGARWGGVSVTDLITGSVRTYNQNGNTNGGPKTDATNSGSLDELMNADITTPGFIRLPVCSSDMAWNAWKLVSDKTSPNWPCFVKPSIGDCGTSSFTDHTSSASPSVNDCMGIVNNIQNTQGEWEVENAVEQQHQIVQSGSCKLGVQGKSINGNVNFHVGAQDIVDIINSSIKQFGGSGKVGAKGTMSCKGDVKTVPVE